MYIKTFQENEQLCRNDNGCPLNFLLKFDVNLWLQATALASALRPAVSYSNGATMCKCTHTTTDIQASLCRSCSEGDTKHWAHSYEEVLPLTTRPTLQVMFEAPVFI